MNNTIRKYLIVFATVLITASCNKFLGVQPKGQQVLTTTGDYNELLNSPVLMTMGALQDINITADIYDNPSAVADATDVASKLYLWEAAPGTTLDNSPTDWNTFYNYISYYNVVLNNIDKATGDVSEKTELKAEALTERANEYLYLTNLYGKEYDSSSASTDLAVPFVTSDDLNDSIPPRSSVQFMYDQMIADLNTAIPNLPESNASNRFRPSVYAAYSILARVYFYKRDYANAAKYAQMALQDPSLAILDYNTPGVVSQTQTPIFPSIQTRSDVIFARYCGGAIGSATQSSGTGLGEPCTLNFIDSYDDSDLRLNLIKINGSANTVVREQNGIKVDTSRGDYSYFLQNGATSFQQNAGPTVAEMKLIIAEAAARSNDLSTALQQINDIRKDRFSPTAYKPLMSNNQDTVINWVLRERLFELPFTGLRWLDMRRLDAEGRMPTLYRYDAKNNIVGELDPHSNRYIWQIPYDVLIYHPNMPQNP